MSVNDAEGYSMLQLANLAHRYEYTAVYAPPNRRPSHRRAQAVSQTKLKLRVAD